jgi:hypothetical protein
MEHTLFVFPAGALCLDPAVSHRNEQPRISQYAKDLMD